MIVNWGRCGLILLALMSAGGRAASADVDLTGRWKTVYPSSEMFAYNGFVDIAQSGGSATVCLTGMSLCVPVDVSPTGSLSNLGPTVPNLQAQLQGTFIDGALFGPCLNCGGNRFFIQRCQCDDGNDMDGDGCDARCQIEPCFTCAGDPSNCAARPDGAACDDGSPCTTGETCAATVCGGGSAVPPPCVDMSGRWLVYAAFDTIHQPPAPMTVEQHGSTLLFGYLGTIDPQTGVFNGAAHSASGPCVLDGVDAITGVASLDGRSWTGTASLVSGVSECSYVLDVQITATRCGGGTVDPGEECDDGNDMDGDGCSSHCQTEPVQPPPPACPFTPRSGCREALHSKLLLRSMQPPTRNTALWTWTGSGAAAPDLGDPVNGTSAYTMCVYGSDGGVPYLAMQMLVPPAGQCGRTPCWSAPHPTDVRYRDQLGAHDGITALRVQSDSGGQEKLRIQGRGAMLPVDDAPGTLAGTLIAAEPAAVVQLSNLDGTCWTSSYAGPSSRSTATHFKGRQ